MREPGTDRGGAEEGRRHSLSDAPDVAPIAVLGHELRAPLATVIGITDMLAQASVPPRERALVEHLQVAARHLMDLMQAMVDATASAGGALRLRPSTLDVRNLVQEAIHIAAAVAQPGVDVVQRVDDDVPAQVHMDPLRLRQVLVNLLTNALRSTIEGSVRVTVSSVGGQGSGRALRIRVDDTGTGMDERTAAELFRPYAVGGSGDGRGPVRTGLGLWICRSIVGAMGGDVHVRSSPGEGYRVQVTIPLDELPDASVAGPAPGRRPLQVLLVEDDGFHRLIGDQMLQNGGHACTAVSTGAAALERLGTASFDVALVDWDLPDIPGPELARRIRRVAPGTPVVAVTAHASPQEEDGACVFDGLLIKPVQGQRLLAEVERFSRIGAPEGAPCA